MRRWLSLLVVALLWASPAHADLIDFTTLTAGPAATLQIGGVTISGEQDALVASVYGVGLGLVGVGADGSIDTVWGPGAAGLTFEGRLTLSVDGWITALTIQPYLRIDGPAPIDGVALSIPMSFLRDGDLIYGTYYAMLPAPFAAVTFDFHGGSSLNPFGDQIHGLTSMGLDADWSLGDVFAPYLNSHDHAPATFSYGYSIMSLEYTPTPTPEPGTLALLALGVGILGVRRYRTSPG
jgi:PEP-CTERM motif-containing protein